MARNPWQRHDQVPTLRFELVTLALHKWLQCPYEFNYKYGVIRDT